MKNNLYLRLIAGAIALLGFVVPAAAGITSAGMNLGNTSAWTAKQTFFTATTSAASINLPHGTAPSSPVNGDLWTTSAGGLFGRINSATKSYANLETAQTWSGQQTFGTSPLKFTHGIISDGNGNGSTTGNARGTGAIDLQTNRGAATQVASGNYSTVIGYRNTASALDSFAIGDSNAISATEAFGIGKGNTITGGNTAFAIGESNSLSTSADGAVGDSNTVSDGYAIGNGHNVSGGTDSFAIGGSCVVDQAGALALNNDTYGGAVNSIAGGYQSKTFNANGWKGSLALASSSHQGSDGSSQSVLYSINNYTTDTTSTTLTSAGEDGSTGGIGLPSSSSRAWMFKALVVGTRATGVSAAYEITGAIKRVGSTTSLIGAVVVTPLEDAGASTWDATAVADDTNEELDINVTGEASVTINWSASVWMSQVTRD